MKIFQGITHVCVEQLNEERAIYGISGEGHNSTGFFPPRIAAGRVRKEELRYRWGQSDTARPKHCKNARVLVWGQETAGRILKYTLGHRSDAEVQKILNKWAETGLVISQLQKLIMTHAKRE